jgi:hypothetical protein
MREKNSITIDITLNSNFIYYNLCKTFHHKIIFVQLLFIISNSNNKLNN